MRLLLLAGTAEATELSHLLEAMEGVEPIVSLAGATRQPAARGGQIRTGGFGGESGLARFLEAEGIDLVIDATHPFASRIAANAAAAAARTDTPRIKLLRPPWPVEPGWREVATLAAALDALPGGATALCTTGSLRTQALGRRPDCRVLLRAIEVPAALPDGVELIRARPPFTVEEETALMRTEGVTHLVTRNAGGAAAGRLTAARELRILVLMIARPPQPHGPIVETVPAALAWVRQRLADASARRSTPPMPEDH